MGEAWLMAVESSELIGIVLPFIPSHARRVFEDHKSVLVKFFSHEPRRLKLGHTLFFYVSRARKEIVGEAEIAKIDTGTMNDILVSYSARPEFLLTESEFVAYVGQRKSKKMLVLSLQKVRKYKIPIQLGKPVSMTGMYMTKDMLHGNEVIGIE